MKVLLIEDEPAVVSVINRGLSEAGYEVSVALDGSNPSFLLIILDVMLPGMNGIEVCRSLRKAQVTIPILMLTALGTTENIVMGLDSGADDYLVKPFKLQELEARIRSLLRRKGNTGIAVPVTPPGILSIADLELDMDTKSASRQGKSIQLTATEYRLLEYLLKNPAWKSWNRYGASTLI
jgi:DNA-binding response OmpR family regulator